VLSVLGALILPFLFAVVPAGGSTPGSAPPTPAGTMRSSAVHPLVYPVSPVQLFGDATIVKRRMPEKPDTLAPVLNSPVVAMVATRQPGGYWLAGADGGVYAYGSARYFGSLGNLTLQGPIVAMAATPDGGGYWLAGIDGGIFAFGDAHYYGSKGSHPSDDPIVAMAATPDGEGYWLAGADGGVYAFGDARSFGSMGDPPLAAPIVDMAVTPDGAGYWLVAGDGGVFTFGDARYYGSLGGQPLVDGIVAMAATPDGHGYWMVAWDGGVFTFGDARFFGSAAEATSAAPVTDIVPTSNGAGYWLLEPDAFKYTFANPPPPGTFPGSASIVAAAESQVQPDPDTGYFCNPYGPCEEWCALFATWAWEQGGVPIPSYAFTGDIYDWAARYGTVLPATASPVPGDAILYGTGPTSTATSLHTGIVAQVWPDGAVVTIEGDAGPSATGHLAVVINGPFLPGDSDSYNGFGVYAFAQP
jgi:hypothetical protein